MANVSTINSTRIELLTKHNYDTWVIQVEALLVKHDSWSYVNGDVVKPEINGEDRTSLDRWIAQDRKAKSDLILSISPTELKHIRNCSTSKEVWDKLKSVYASQGPMRKATLLEQLLLRKMNEDDDVRDYLSRFMDTVDKLSNMEVEINGDLLSIMLLHSLPDGFDNFCCAIKSRDNLPDVDTLMIKIIEEHDSKIHRSGDSSTSAMLSKQHSKSSKGSSTDRPRNGKVIANAPKYKCHYCKKKGHKAADCFKRKRDAEKEGTEKSNTEKANTTTDVFHADEARNVTAAETCKNATNEKWCLDSGCTSHLCKDFQLFAHKTCSGIKLANETTARATARGDVNIVTSNGEKNREVMLTNTLYVPDLRTNLLSIAKIVDRDHEVLFTKRHAYVKDAKGTVKMIADREGDLFYLNDGHDSASIASSVSTNVAEDWHRRLVI